MSLPTGSVPKRWPCENGSKFALRMLPPVGLPTGPMSGHTKNASSRTTSTPAGIATSSERIQPRRRAIGSPAEGASVIAGICASVSGSCAPIADPRVEHRVQEVGDEVAEHDDEGE